MFGRVVGNDQNEFLLAPLEDEELKAILGSSQVDQAPILDCWPILNQVL